MFVITEADAAAIRAVFNDEGELSAVIELRRRIQDHGQRERADVRPEHRRVDANASPDSPGDRTASPQGQLATRPAAGSTASYGQGLRATAMRSLRTDDRLDPELEKRDEPDRMRGASAATSRPL